MHQVKRILQEVKEFKAASFATPFWMLVEVFCETIWL